MSEQKEPLHPNLELQQLREQVQKLMAERTAVAQAENLFRLITDNVADMLAVVDFNAQFRWVNQAYFTTLGWEAAELEGTEFVERIHNEDQYQVHQTLMAALQQNEGQKTEYRVRDANQQWMRLETVMQPVAEDEGQADFIVMVSHDVSHRERMQAELIKSKSNEAVASLASGVGRRFERLIEEMLEDVRLTAQARSNPGAIMTHLEGLEHRLSDGQKIVQHLLSLEQDEDARLAEVDAEAIVREVARRVTQNSLGRCEFWFDNDLPLVRIEEEAFERALANILLNAVESLSQRSVIKITGRHVAFGPESKTRPPQLDPGSYVELEIRDQGCGIDANDVARVFEPYFSRKEKSQGMGLTVALSLISRQGGTILIESRERVGTSVELYVPTIRKVVTEEETAGFSRQRTKGRRVLLMDDDAVVRQFASNMLKNVGCEAVMATDGEDAVRQYEKTMAAGKRFDVVILDLTVKNGMGGGAAIHSLRQLDGDVMAIAADNELSQPEMEDPEQYGFVAAIQKPYNQDRLGMLLDQLFEEMGA